MSTNNSWNNQIASANSGITLNSGTNVINISSDAANTTCNFATGAGVKLVQLGSTNTASSLALRYGTGDFTLASATGTVMSVLDTGEATMPLQSAFLARKSAQSLNVTGDGTVFQQIFDVVHWDQSNDYNNVTGVFTAPVTGRYESYTYSLYGGTGVATICQTSCVTSNRTYIFGSMNPQSNLGGNTRFYINEQCLMDMDIGDTAYMTQMASGTTKTVDSDPSQNFGIILLC